MTADCFLHGPFDAAQVRCPVCTVTRERDKAVEALRSAIGFVQTGGPLHTADRLELIELLHAGLDDDRESR